MKRVLLSYMALVCFKWATGDVGYEVTTLEGCFAVRLWDFHTLNNSLRVSLRNDRYEEFVFKRLRNWLWALNQSLASVAVSIHEVIAVGDSICRGGDDQLIVGSKTDVVRINLIVDPLLRVDLLFGALLCLSKLLLELGYLHPWLFQLSDGVPLFNQFELLLLIVFLDLFCGAPTLWADLDHVCGLSVGYYKDKRLWQKIKDTIFRGWFTYLRHVWKTHRFWKFLALVLSPVCASTWAFRFVSRSLPRPSYRSLSSASRARSSLWTVLVAYPCRDLLASSSPDRHVLCLSRGCAQ